MRGRAMLAVLVVALAWVVPVGIAGARSQFQAPVPVIRDLRPETPDLARLSWKREGGATYRLCFAADYAMSVFGFCEDVGSSNSWLVRAPDEDGAAWYMTLLACRDDACSDPTRAGAVGRRVRDGYDFIATALIPADGRMRMAAMARTRTLNLRFYRGAWGFGDLYESACPESEAGQACVSADAVSRGALAGIAAWRPGAPELGLTLQVRDKPRIAFMFDDGTGVVQGGKYVMQSILDEYGVKGSFFLTGKAMQTYPMAVRALVAAGHRVGNHTYSHPYLTTFGDAAVGTELDQAELIYRSLVPGGTLKPCFRAPNGDFNARVLTVVRNRGYAQYTQSVSSMDYAKASSAEIVRNVVAGAQDGASVSFHTQEMQTAPALRLLIPRFLAEGYQFVTVC